MNDNIFKRTEMSLLTWFLEPKFSTLCAKSIGTFQFMHVSISCWLASVLTLEPTDYGTVGGCQVIATGQPVLGLLSVTSPCTVPAWPTCTRRSPPLGQLPPRRPGARPLAATQTSARLLLCPSGVPCKRTSPLCHFLKKFTVFLTEKLRSGAGWVMPGTDRGPGRPWPGTNLRQCHRPTRARGSFSARRSCGRFCRAGGVLTASGFSEPLKTRRGLTALR